LKNLRERKPHSLEIPLFPPFQKSAWESAIASGYYDPQTQFWVYYSHIYNAMENFNLNANFANDIAYKTTRSDEVRDERLLSIYTLLLSQVQEIMVIIDESTKQLEKELSISREEIKRLNDNIIKRIDKIMGIQ
jgi:hypothetical protein